MRCFFPRWLPRRTSGHPGVADVFGSRLRGDNGWIDQSQSARGKLGFISNGGLIVELGFISNEAELAQFNAKYWSAAKAVAMILIKHSK